MKAAGFLFFQEPPTVPQAQAVPACPLQCLTALQRKTV